MLSPVLDELAKEMGEKLKIAKVDVHENMDLAIRFGVQGIPLLILFKDGNEVARAAGFRPKSQLSGWVESQLK